MTNTRYLIHYVNMGPSRATYELTEERDGKRKETWLVHATRGYLIVTNQCEPPVTFGWSPDPSVLGTLRWVAEQTDDEPKPTIGTSGLDAAMEFDAGAARKWLRSHIEMLGLRDDEVTLDTARDVVALLDIITAHSDFDGELDRLYADHEVYPELTRRTRQRVIEARKAVRGLATCLDNKDLASAPR